MKLHLFDIVSVAAVISYFIPLLIVLTRKLWKDSFFMLFAIYWAIGGVVNVCDVLPFFSKNTCYLVGVFYNMLDIPFVLSILYHTSNSRQVKKFIPFAAAVIVCMEIYGVVLSGLVYDSLKYSLGAGILVVLSIVTTEIIRYLQTIEHSTRQTAKAFIYAAVLFEYATFIVIYVFDYYIETAETVDSYFIYYFSTIVAIVIACCGYLLSRKYEKPVGVY